MKYARNLEALNLSGHSIKHMIRNLFTFCSKYKFHDKLNARPKMRRDWSKTIFISASFAQKLQAKKSYAIMSAKLIYLKQIIDRAGQGGLSETNFRAGINQMKQRHTLGKATPVTAGDR